MKKMILMALAPLALQSGVAFAASQLTCRVNENTPKRPSLNYTLSAPVEADHARIDISSGKILPLSFGAETFVSQDLDPGQQLILISATDKAGYVGSSTAGVGTVIFFFDNAQGDLSVQCAVQ